MVTDGMVIHLLLEPGLAQMMDQNGGFPEELKRTKPYGYSLFVLDAMAGVAQITSTPNDKLWTYELKDGRGMKKGLAFIMPYVIDKKAWPMKPDVMYWSEWPVRHPSILLGGLIFKNKVISHSMHIVLKDKTFIFLLLNLRALKIDFFIIETLSSEVNK